MDTRKFVAKTCENQGTDSAERAWQQMSPKYFISYCFYGFYAGFTRVHTGARVAEYSAEHFNRQPIATPGDKNPSQCINT